MRSSPVSSRSSWTCRLEWRPSRLLVASLLLLGVLAAGSLMASGLPPAAKIPAAIAAAAYAVFAAAREATRAVGVLEWSGADAPAWWCEGDAALALRDVRLLEQGPWLRLQGRDAGGRVHRLLWWPDTATRAERRALRLAAAVSGRSDIPLPSLSG